MGSGSLRPTAHEVEIEVRYAETDQMGVVHHSNYLVWFELARTGLCRRSGFPYADIEKLGYYLMVTRTETRFLRGARYGDTVRVRCQLARMASRGLRFTYRVELGAELLATGGTEHIWVLQATGRPCHTPEEVEPAFRRLAGLEA